MLPLRAHPAYVGVVLPGEPDGELLRQAITTIAVTRVLNAYCYAVDARDVDAAVELFDEDCEFDWGFGRVSRGREGVRDLLASLSRWDATSHHLANVIVNLSGDGAAHCSSYVYAWHRVASTGAIEQLWGQYLDVLVQSPAGWRFRSRVLRCAGEEGFPAVEHQTGNFERLPRR